MARSEGLSPYIHVMKDFPRYLHTFIINIILSILEIHIHGKKL